MVASVQNLPELFKIVKQKNFVAYVQCKVDDASQILSHELNIKTGYDVKTSLFYPPATKNDSDIISLSAL